MTESEHQILLMCWAKKSALAGRPELDLLFHIPNGGSRSGREGVMFKAMGVKPGVSDLFLPVKHWDGRGGLWLEMKAEGGRESEDQIKWLNLMRSGGYEARLAFGWEEAVEAIKEYLGGEWPSVEMGEMAGRMCSATAGSAKAAK
jgi:hypothetical protein